jgi:CheY-like chemotaxis protein
VSNITANALQNTTTGWVRVEMYLAYREEQRIGVDIVVEDSGVGMSNAKLDALFRDLEQVSTDGDDLLGEDSSWRSGYSSTRDQNNALADSKNGNRILGLGLAVVARIVRNMEGQLRLKSKEGEGSRFVVQLPFDLPDNAESHSTQTDSDRTEREDSTIPPVAPVGADGEVMLVDRASSITKSDHVPVRKRSIEESSLRSVKSGVSEDLSMKSNRSDVDRLIDAISGPFLIDGSEKLHRSNSRDSKASSLHSRKSAPNVGYVPVGQGSHEVSHETIQDRPGRLTRSKSYGTAEHHVSSIINPPGSAAVNDSKTPVKAIRMPDEYTSAEIQPPSAASRVLFDVPDNDKQKATKKAHEAKEQDSGSLEVLVAEDDPVNSRIVQKRLEKVGHAVHLTVNGEECASAFGETPSRFGVVLMDMQMPIVDGLTSTKMIRSFEKAHPDGGLSSRAQSNGRIPIFAVSASLVEREREKYINAGFDGWILKPIDFKRLNTLLTGIDDTKVRNDSLYTPGQWERGGWFHRYQPNVFRAATWPSEGPPVSLPPTGDDNSTEMSSDKNILNDSESGGTETPTNKPKKRSFIDERSSESHQSTEDKDDVEVVASGDAALRTAKEEESMSLRKVDRDRQIEDVTDIPDA